MTTSLLVCLPLTLLTFCSPLLRLLSSWLFFCHSERCSCVEGDLTEVLTSERFQKATVVSLYLLPEAIATLRPHLDAALHRGVRQLWRGEPTTRWWSSSSSSSSCSFGSCSSMFKRRLLSGSIEFHRAYDSFPLIYAWVTLSTSCSLVLACLRVFLMSERVKSFGTN